MFLPFEEPVVQAALREAVSNLAPLLTNLENMLQCGVLHELSCIISDPGAPT